MITYNAIYYGYLHHAGKLLNVKVTFVRDGLHITRIHIQDYVFYTFKGALNCLQELAKDVLTDVTEAELIEMNQKRGIV
jgi:hypothetical protein